MKNDIDPAQEGMTERPKNAVIDVPAQEGGEHRPDAAENSTTTTATSRRVFVFSHIQSIPALLPPLASNEVAIQKFYLLTMGQKRHPLASAFLGCLPSPLFLRLRLREFLFSHSHQGTNPLLVINSFANQK